MTRSLPGVFLKKGSTPYRYKASLYVRLFIFNIAKKGCAPLKMFLKWMTLQAMLVMVVQFTLATVISAQDTKFTALMLINFAKNIDWPDPSGDFTITMLGDDPVFEELISLANKAPLGNRTMVVKKASSLNTIEKCQMLYITPDLSSNLPSAVAKFGSVNTLIVTFKAGMAKIGAGINFSMVNGQLKFEINGKSIKKSGLVPKLVLFKLGTVIN